MISKFRVIARAGDKDLANHLNPPSWCPPERLFERFSLMRSQNMVVLQPSHHDSRTLATALGEGVNRITKYPSSLHPRADVKAL
jgi:hypothetical protein